MCDVSHGRLGKAPLGMGQVPPKALLPEQGAATGGLAGVRCVPENTAQAVSGCRVVPKAKRLPQSRARSQEPLISSSTAG